jgi:hypothetical protein
VKQMPQDVKGNNLHIGDKVRFAGTITAIDADGGLTIEALPQVAKAPATVTVAAGSTELVETGPRIAVASRQRDELNQERDQQLRQGETQLKDEKTEPTEAARLQEQKDARFNPAVQQDPNAAGFNRQPAKDFPSWPRHSDAPHPEDDSATNG